jgi:hypothetical protein
MIDQALLARLKPAIDRCRKQRMFIGATLGLSFAAGLASYLWWRIDFGKGAEGQGLAAIEQWFSVYNPVRRLLVPVALALGGIGALIGWLLRPNVLTVAKRLERKFPDLNGRLTTALEQVSGEDGKFTFLQEHLFAETIHHSTQQDWRKVIPDASLRGTYVLPAIALTAFLIIWRQLPGPVFVLPSDTRHEAHGVEVTPGDTELEKGTALILLAKFHNQMPAAAELVIGESAESERRLPLTRSLSDPVYGGSVPEVNESFIYRVSWEGGSTRSFKVNVFEFPKLERSDVTLMYPDYTKLPPKRIEDTRHTSAVEGTRLDLELVLNKPVASAVLTPKKNTKDAGDVKEIALEVSPDKPAALLRGHVPAQSARYELVLTDADGRRSKQAVPFSFDVVPNRVPEMKLASPRGDQTPSALQEILFDGTVWDDFGVVACGLEVTTPGGEMVTVEFGKDVPAKEKRAFQQLLRMEELKAVPDQLFAWHAWADDIGPDGKVRRTRGDLFFAEVRAFEEIFRQGEGMDSQQQQQQDQQQQQQGQQGQAEQLVKLQKQIITATWKLAQRPEPARKAEDIEVVRDSQADAQSQAEAAAGEAGGSPATAALWQGALQSMQQALEKLEKATEAPAELASAVAPEQAAYQALLKLKEREFQVSRQNRQQQQQQSQQGQSQGEQQQQQQLDQLDLAKNEDRYETQREAQAQQSAERREQMQVLNRLKELAQRQDDVNEKLKELQTALNEARTEEEKEAARRELKRLEEEQRQMLADADELKQRMEQQQNQAETAEQREQLDQARENMQQAAEAAAQGQASQALASGTRAQEQMEQMREELRRQSASAFEEELRQMRADAREIARKQEEIAKELQTDQSDKSDPSNKPDLSDKPRQAPSLGEQPPEDKLAEQLQQQEQRTGELVQRAQELSEQAEPSEPLLSRQIYETARKFAQDDANAVKEAQQELVREGRLSRDGFDQLRELQEREQAGRALRLTNELQQQNLNREAARTGERAREGLNRLRDGIEQAAESVLGDDTAALQLAEQQLQEAAEAMQREMEQQNGQQPREQNQQANAGSQRQPQGNGQRPGGDPRGGEPQTAQNEPSKGQQDSGQNQPREGQQETAQNQEGEQPGQRSGQPQQGQANARQPGQRQGGGQPQGEQQPGEPQPSERQPGERNQEVAQNEQQQGPPQEGEGQQPGGQQGQGRQPGEQQGQGGQPGERRSNEGRSATSRSGQRQPNANEGGRGGGPEEDLIETARGPRDRRPAARDPLTGEGFTDWSDSLREAEELVDQSDLRNDIAQARERARQMRLDMRKAEKKPDWAVVQLEIVKPLVEVRDRLRQELARRDSDKALVPVDRDPVPAQFTENVRRYYEQLGKDQ